MSLKKFVTIDLIITLALCLILGGLVAHKNFKLERDIKRSIQLRKDTEKDTEAMKRISGEIGRMIEGVDSCIDWNKKAIKPNPKGR